MPGTVLRLADRDRLPGDLMLTGSPTGNELATTCDGRLLRPGDVIEAEISGLGMQRNRCIAEPPDASDRP